MAYGNDEQHRHAEKDAVLCIAISEHNTKAKPNQTALLRPKYRKN